MARVVLGVSGGIAAYKACELLRRLRAAGHAVRVVPTAGALEFVGRATWEALAGEPVTSTVWEGAVSVEHVALGRSADLVVVAPATADLLARLAGGRADDLLTSTLLTASAPVLLAPAMHTEMWAHAAVVANVALLRSRGVTVMDPASGRLTGPDSGTGRLPEAAELFEAAAVVLARGPNLGVGVAGGRDLAGRAVVISAGGTREPLDPVRWLGNRSSGRQGYALAAAAGLRGAAVHLISANVSLPAPAGATVHEVGSARELQAALQPLAAGADAIVMAAAVADFRPAQVSDGKVKTGEGAPAVLPLTRNPDILAGLGAARTRPGQVLVGFAAETPDTSGLEAARDKLARKGADLLVLNEVGSEARTGTGFETEDNAVTIIGADGSTVPVPRASKALVAHAVWDAVSRRLN